MSSRWDSVEKAYYFLQANVGKLISLKDLADNSGWSVGTARTHRSKKLGSILIPSETEKGLYEVKEIEHLDLVGFKQLLSQKLGTTSNPTPTMSNQIFDPFSEENLKTIFRREGGNKVADCEAFSVEHKQTFDFGSKSLYAKVIASFANNDGGYLIFGVTPQREAVGLVSNNFENFDLEKLTSYLLRSLSCEIKLKQHIFREADTGMKFGLLYTYTSSNKPIIAKVSDRDLGEGEIYYRYSAVSKKIGYAELSLILEEMRNRALLSSYLEKIQTAGPKNIAIMNTLTGEVQGAEGKFYIDEESIEKVKFIREGQFSEIDGAPTLKLIGEVTPIAGTAIRKIVTPKAVNEETIITDFLDQLQISDPQLYITEICNQNTWYLPIYYYIHLSKKTIPEVIEIIDNLHYRKHIQNNLIERLKNDNRLVIGGDISIDPTKRELLKKIRTQTLPETMDENYINAFFQVITLLQPQDFDWEYLREKLKYYRTIALHNGLASAYKTTSRKAVCYLDKLLFFQKCKT